MYQSKNTTSTAILLASATMFFAGVLHWSSLDWFPRIFNLGYGFKLPLPPAESAILDVLTHQADLAVLCLMVVACATVLLAVCALVLVLTGAVCLTVHLVKKRRRARR